MILYVLNGLIDKALPSDEGVKVRVYRLLIVFIGPLSGGHVPGRDRVGVGALLLRGQRGGGAGRQRGAPAAAGGAAQRGVERSRAAHRPHPVLHQPAQLHGPLHRGR